MHPNHDVAWYLYLAHRVLQGDVLYRDFIESNPPLIVWLCLPVAWFSQATGWLDILIYQVAVLLVIALMLLIADRLRADQPLRERLALAVGTAVVLLFLPGYDFGQREHLAVILLVPMVALALRRAAGGEVSIGMAAFVGLVGATGLLLKPYFLLAWLGLWLATGRRLRLEQVMLGAAGAIYAAAILALTPDYLPMIRLLWPVYGYLYPRPPIAILFSRQGLILLAGLLGIAATRPSVSRGAWVWLAVGGGFLLGAVVQAKGLSYQLYPVVASAMLALVTATLTSGPARILVAGGFIALLVRGPEIFGTVHSYQPGMRLLSVVKAHGPDTRILILSESLRDGFPLVNVSRAEWGMGFPMAWIPAALDTAGTRPRAQMSPAEAFAFDHVVRAVSEGQPRLLIVRSSGFPYLSYYRQAPAFAAALQHYRLVAGPPEFRVYERDLSSTRGR
jgi:hypothetical protein